MTLPGEDKIKAKGVVKPMGHAGSPRVAAGCLGSPWFVVPGQQPEEEGGGLYLVSLCVFAVHFKE